MLTDEELSAVGATVPAGRGYTERRDRAIADAAASHQSDAIAICIRVRDQLSEEGNPIWHGAQRCVMALNVALLERDCQFNEEQQAMVENATLAKVERP